MAATESAMLPLGTPAPDFSLPDAAGGQTVQLADFTGKRGLLVMFSARIAPTSSTSGGARAGCRDYARRALGS